MKLQNLELGDQFYFEIDKEKNIYTVVKHFTNSVKCVDIQGNQFFFGTIQHTSIKTYGKITEELAEKFLKTISKELDEKRLEDLSESRKLQIQENFYNSKRSQQDKLLKDSGVSLEMMIDYLVKIKSNE